MVQMVKHFQFYSVLEGYHFTFFCSYADYYLNMNCLSAHTFQLTIKPPHHVRRKEFYNIQSKQRSISTFLKKNKKSKTATLFYHALLS